MPHCAVTMASVIRNNGEETLHFHIFGLNIDDEDKSKLKKTVREKEISFYDVSGDLVKDLPNLNGDSYISAASYIRLFLCDFLDKDIYKVIYLDCDLIVRSSLSGLWNTDIEGFAVAAAEDLMVKSGTWHDMDETWLGYSTGFGYFNSGVLLINLKYWRENNVKESFYACMDKYASQFKFHDQDVLNGVFYNKKKTLDNKWNTFDAYYYKWRPEHRDDIECMHRTDPCIIHYAGRLKPWNTIVRHHLFDEYRKYRDHTPWPYAKPSFREMKNVEKHKYIWFACLGVDKIYLKWRLKRRFDKHYGR